MADAPNPLRQIQRDLCEIDRPFVQLKCEILNLSLPTMRIYTDGKMETIHSPEVVGQLAEVDKLWDEARRAYFQRREDFGPNGDATTPGFLKEVSRG